MSAIADRLAAVRREMDDAMVRAGRSDNVTLVAVSKGQPVEAIEAAFAAGHRDFGESRGQALAAKADELSGDVRWHFIGPLQTNKVRIVRPHVCLMHAFDRQSLVGPWLKGLGVPPPALLQVNVGQEPQKSGVEPDDVEPTFERWTEAGIDLRGLMAIPPFDEDPDRTRRHFQRMRRIRDDVSLHLGRPLELSLGMTSDFGVAIEEGSTMIRVGTAIFGPRGR